MSTIDSSTLTRWGALPKRVVKLPKELAGEVGARGRGVWLAGLGALAAVEQEGAELVETLVKQGEKLVERGEQVEAKGRERIAGVRDDLAGRQKQVGSRVQAVEAEVTDAMGSTLKRLGVPTRAEVQELSGKVDALTSRVAALIDAMQKPAVRPVFSVAARQDGWAVTLAGKADAHAVYPTKDEAVDAARSLAGAHAPSQLVIHRRDGSVQDTLSYEA